MSEPQLENIHTFDELKDYLDEVLRWPIEDMDIEELTFDYDPDKDLGLDPKTAAKIKGIKQLRPLHSRQPFGIFFVEFDRKRLPVVAMRRILGKLVTRKRESANPSHRATWNQDDLLFVSAYGNDESRRIDFAHFADDAENGLPTLRVLGWDGDDTERKLDFVDKQLRKHLHWADDETIDEWRIRWREGFVLRHREVITTASALAVRLADLARDIRSRVNAAFAVESDKGPLTTLMKAFRESLIHDLEPDDFADMYAQTIAYGLLSARVSRPAGLVADNLADMVPVTNPFLKELMETFLNVGGRKWSSDKGKLVGIDFDELGVNEVVETLRDANMEAVLRDFDNRNPQEDPVLHFYEHFLKEYDAKKRMQRGVFYTPKPVVSYIVRSVHELLQTEFGLPLGLADTTTWGEMAERHDGFAIPEGTPPDTPFVQILDPATGTATFLVGVIDLIHKTMTEHWQSEGVRGELFLRQKWNEYVPKHLLPRLHGYELMMAPYAIAHMKIGLKLFETGYTFEDDERARVYLTNTLEPPQDFSEYFEQMVPALAHEARAVNNVKRHQRFTAVIGNPPYLGEAGRGGEWIAGLMRGKDTVTGRKTLSYFEVDGNSLNERNSKWINDDYVKFIRLSHFLLDTTGCGVHGYISNHGYLDNPTFRGMRWALLSSFNTIYALDLHGNLKKKEKSPDGGKDVNVFDIEQGVGIGLFVKRRAGTHDVNAATVQHADLWGERTVKYDWLMGHALIRTEWAPADASKPFYLFEPLDSSEVGNYFDWPAVNEVMSLNSVGIVTARDDLTIQWSPKVVWDTVTDFAAGEPESLRSKYNLGKDVRDWKVSYAQADLRRTGPSKDQIAPILYRPFDIRFTYYTDRSRGFLCMPRGDVMPHMLAGENLAIMIGRAGQVIGSDDWDIVHAGRGITDLNYYRRGGNNLFPLYLYPGVGKSDSSMFQTWSAGKNGRRPNLDPGFIEAIGSAAGLGFVSDGRGDLKKTYGPEDALAYIYTIFHSPEYRRRFEPMLKLDFPRVPPPAQIEPFRSLIPLGHDLLALHLLESPLLDQPIASYNAPSNPEVEKAVYTPEDQTVWLDLAKTRGFTGVPEEVWNFHIGGYQVCHKWLKDRQKKGGKNPRPGRTLTLDDITHYCKIVTALHHTIRLMGEIDETIEAHGGWPGAFVTEKKES